MTAFLTTLLLSATVTPTLCFRAPCTAVARPRRLGHSRVHMSAGGATAMVPAAVSLVAGSLGGAIGLGVAYPLDTLKTKTQSSAGDSMPSNPFALAARIYRDEGIPGFCELLPFPTCGPRTCLPLPATACRNLTGWGVTRLTRQIAE